MADDATLETDPELFNCETCPVADALAEIEADRPNCEAWRLYEQAVNRFTVDTHCVPLAVKAVMGERSSEDIADLLERFAVLYSIANPAPEPKP
jgi:hypothetical protein